MQRATLTNSESANGSYASGAVVVSRVDCQVSFNWQLAPCRPSCNMLEQNTLPGKECDHEWATGSFIGSLPHNLAKSVVPNVTVACLGALISMQFVQHMAP